MTIETTDPAEGLRLRDLGPLEVLVGGRPVALTSGPGRALLLSLAAGAGQPVSADRLLEEIWQGAPPASGRKALQVHVHGLRRALGDGAAAVATDPGGYRLDLDSQQVDSWRFRQLVSDVPALPSEPERDALVGVLGEALDLWRGEAFGGLDLPLLVAVRAELDRLRLTAVERRAELAIASGSAREVADGLLAEVEHHPYREHLAALAATALHQSARTAEALELLASVAGRLRKDLGLEPGAELRATEQVLLHDTDAPAPQHAGPREQPGSGLAGRIVEDGAAPEDAAPGNAPPEERAPSGGRSGPRTFVGRATALDQVATALATARAGHGQLVLISGDAGIGKTRLAEESVSRLGRPGERIAWARFGEHGGTAPLEPLVTAITGSRTVAGDAVTPPPPQRLDDGAVLRQRRLLVDALRPGAGGPTVLVLDDLHWADTASLRLLVHLADELPGLPVLVMGLFRDTAGSVRPEVPDHLASLLTRSTSHLVLAPLDPTDARAYLDQLLMGASRVVDPAVRETLVERSDGNPLFLTELAAAAATLGPDELREGAPIPAALRTMLDRRIRRLDDEDRAVLGVASVVGRRFDTGTVAAAADVDVSTVSAVIARATENDLLTAADAAGAHRFRHALVRDAVYAAMPVADRARIHSRVADALGSSLVLDRHSACTQIAYHRVQALAAGGVTAAAEACVAAGDVSADALAYEDAARFYRATLDLTPSAPRLDPRFPAAAAAGLGDALARAGRLGEALPALQQAATLVTGLDDAPLLAKTALASTIVASPAGGPNPAWVADLRGAALRALGAVDDPYRLRLLVDEGLSGYLTERRLAGVEPVTEAEAMARRIGDDTGLAYALTGHVQIVWGPDTTGERVRLASEAARTARRGDDVVSECFAHVLATAALLEQGRVADADMELAAAEHLAPATRRPLLSWLTRTWRALRAAMTGDLDEAEEQVTAALLCWGEAPTEDALGCYGTQLALLRLLEGRGLEVVDLVRAQAGLRPELPVFRAVLALLLAAGPERDEAGRIVESLLDDGLDRLPRDVTWTAAMAAITETLWLLERSEPADALAAMLAPVADQHVVLPSFGGGGAYWGSVSHLLGLVESLRGDRQAALRWFEAAAADHERCGTVPWLARTLEAHALLLGRSSGSSDRRRADELHGRARAIADPLGLALPVPVSAT